MKKYMMLFVLCALLLVVSTGVLAVDNPFQVAVDKAVDAFKGARNLVFTIGGFALIGLAVAAVFGKVNWKWVGALAIGLGILAVAGAIVDYASTSDAGMGSGTKIGQLEDLW